MNKKKIVFIATIAAAIFTSTSVINAQSRSRKVTAKKPVAVQKKPVIPPSGAVRTESGLIYLITGKGTGVQAKAGDTVMVHYTGTLTSGAKFDSSWDRNAPISFPLGAGRVIKGWDEGIAKMHVGDQAILVIPPEIGYGVRGKGPIPPNSTLIFIVELVDAKSPEPPAAAPPNGKP